MPEFLNLLPPSKALELFLKNLPEKRLPIERVSSVQALGRIIGTTIYSPENSPAFNRSTVDGYAVMALDTYGASEAQPAYLKIAGEVRMGEKAEIALQFGSCALIHTGGMLPAEADAVVMVEHTQLVTDHEVEILRAAAVGDNVIKIGEDIKEGEVIFNAGDVVTPAVAGSLLAVGLSEIDVYQKPRVGIISSGDEVVSPDQLPVHGQVRDINSYTLSALVENEGGVAKHYGIQPDDFEVMSVTFRQALHDCDLVLITAGSSASTRDLTAAVIQTMGPPGVLVHGVNVKPGKPTILAGCQGKPVLGLPGNPVSALVIARRFLRPVIHKLSGRKSSAGTFSKTAELSVNLSSSSGREDWVPVRLIERDGILFADPIFYKSNLIFNLAHADGLILIPEDANGLAAGSLIEVYPL